MVPDYPDKSKSFPNYAGRSDVDELLIKELEDAGITANNYSFLKDGSGEVKSGVFGELPYWGFRRAWYYWVANGAGIPPEYAEQLHKTHGQVVRVDGHCGCPSPLEWFEGFAVDRYHVDSPEGLKALADTIKQVIEDAKQKSI